MEEGKKEAYSYHTEGDTAVEIPSMKIIFPTKILTVSRRSDANEVAGKRLSRAELKRRLITAITQNGKIASEKERIKEEKRQERERKKEERRQEKEKEREAEAAVKETKRELKQLQREARRNGWEEGKKKFKAKYLIPILIPIVLLAGARACAKNLDESSPNKETSSMVGDKDDTRETDESIEIPEIETEDSSITETEPRTTTITRTETVPIDLTVYNIDNPSTILEGLVNSSGQEGLTANLNSRSSFEGTYYSSHTQFGEEEKAVEGVEEFQSWKATIDAHMETLANPNASTEQKAQAIQGILALQQGMRDSYSSRVGMTEQHAEAFATASEAFRDSHTDTEEIAVNLMVEKYMAQLGLSSENVAQLEILGGLIEDGYTPTITSVRQEKDGDYRITGTMLREVTEEVVIGEAAQTWQGFANYTRGQVTNERSVTEHGEEEPTGTTSYAVEETREER